jgi:hypothetical protein
MPLQGKRPPLQPQDAAVHIEAAAAAAAAAFQGQVMVPGHAHAGAPAAFQAFAVPDMAALIDVQGSCCLFDSSSSFVKCMHKHTVG